MEVICRKYLGQCLARRGGPKYETRLLSSLSLLMFMSYPARITEKLTDQYGGWGGCVEKVVARGQCLLPLSPMTQGGFSTSLEPSRTPGHEAGLAVTAQGTAAGIQCHSTHEVFRAARGTK